MKVNLEDLNQEAMKKTGRSTISKFFRTSKHFDKERLDK